MDDLEQRVLLIMATGTMGNNEKARAIIPMVLEEAAKVAESIRVDGPKQQDGSWLSWSGSATDAAAAIRAIGAR